MSATADTDKFAKYFEGFGPINSKSEKYPNVITVPGRCYPITKTYLDTVVRALRTRRYHWNSILKSPADIRYIEGELASEFKNSTCASLTSETDTGESSITLSNHEKLFPIKLIISTISYCLRNSTYGGILVFLPGWREIVQVKKHLERIVNGEKVRINLLHSSIDIESQRDVFEELPPECRRIVLATNIAETSVTVSFIFF